MDEITRLRAWLVFLQREDCDEGTWASEDEVCVDFYRNIDMALKGKPAPIRCKPTKQP